MRQLLNKIYSPLLAVLWNLLLVYLVYQIARLEYYVENRDYLSYTWDIFQGGLLALWRILRCNPFSHGGYDPVP